MLAIQFRGAGLTCKACHNLFWNTFWLFRMAKIVTYFKDFKYPNIPISKKCTFSFLFKTRGENAMIWEGCVIFNVYFRFIFIG